MSEKTTDKKATLQSWLQIALELELATIPPYLIALLSIKLPTNREAAELIRSVMVEEMLHLALVANVLNAVGGSPRLDKKALPRYPLQMNFEGETFRDRKFPIDLAPFSASTIETFMKIEEPASRKPDFELLSTKIRIPGLTIGDFYARIILLLRELDSLGPGSVFNGEPGRQIQKDYYWSGGGEIVAVSDLPTAVAALDTVISQGEGAWVPEKGVASMGFGAAMEMGHYYRFSEISHGRRYKPADDPAGSPTGDILAVDYAAVYPIKVNARATDYKRGSKLAILNNAFNSRYTVMMKQLEEAMNGTPKALYTAIMDSMHGLTPVAHEMMKITIDGDPGGHTGCPTFEWVE